MAQRIQRKRAKGWRMPEGAKYIGRPTKWGNPFKVGRDGTAAECVAQYRAWLCEGMATNDADLEGMLWVRGLDLAELRGKDLACFCSLSQPCHADVLLELIAAPDAAKE